MTPESFIERFHDNPKLLKAVIRVKYKTGDEKARQIALKVMYLKPVTLLEFSSTGVVYAVRAVKGIAFLSDYLAETKKYETASDFEYVRNPLIDKRHGLIFNIETSHEAAASFMFAAYEGFGVAPVAEHGAQYVLRGHGYYRSSVGGGKFFVGRVLFDTDVLDANDVAVLEGSITVVETVEDFAGARDFSRGY